MGSKLFNGCICVHVCVCMCVYQQSHQFALVLQLRQQQFRFAWRCFFKVCQLVASQRYTQNGSGPQGGIGSPGIHIWNYASVETTKNHWLLESPAKKPASKTGISGSLLTVFLHKRMELYFFIIVCRTSRLSSNIHLQISWDDLLRLSETCKLLRTSCHRYDSMIVRVKIC